MCIYIYTYIYIYIALAPHVWPSKRSTHREHFSTINTDNNNDNNNNSSMHGNSTILMLLILLIGILTITCMITEPPTCLLRPAWPTETHFSNAATDGNHRFKLFRRGFLEGYSCPRKRQTLGDPWSILHTYPGWDLLGVAPVRLRLHQLVPGQVGGVLQPYCYYHHYDYHHYHYYHYYYYYVYHDYHYCYCVYIHIYIYIYIASPRRQKR